MWRRSVTCNKYAVVYDILETLRSALFWYFMQHRIVVSHWRFGTIYWSLNVGMKLVFYTAWNPKIAQFSFTPQQNPEIMHTWTLFKHAWNVCHTLLTHNLHFITKDFFSLFIPAVFFQCFRKYCRFQSIHSQFLYMYIFTVCHEDDMFRPLLF